MSDGSWFVSTVLSQILIRSLSMPSSVFPLDRLIYHVYLTCLPFNPGSTKHLCSPGAPCILARAFLSPVLDLRLVASSWNTAVLAFQQTKRGAFFEQVEDGVYYPHPWHINTRIRKAVLLSRYRVFYTIASEDGSRGVFLAYDLGEGCAAGRQVVIKAWVENSDFECQREVAAYRALSASAGLGPCKGVPTPVGLPQAQHDPMCDLYALVLPKLGPTLEDLRALLPDGRFDLRMVLVVAIQMIDRYQSIHARGLIHNGMKPANICLAPRDSSDPPGMLYCIDFGFTTELDVHAESPLPSPHRIDAIGNRRFMSVFAHHGISQSQRDDLESLAYLLSYLFHGQLPWDPPSTSTSPTRSSSMSPENRKNQQQQPHVWRLKTATSASVLFRDMDDCFTEFWRDLKGLGHAEMPDYAKIRGRFVRCLDQVERNSGQGEFGWLDVWDRASAS
ncbi:kinase-like domain-containing protein [Roridomyces roridus]|uniref:Kinase-like domain-containing protein n=1 Tax=Roridomyces roridus TaxID=1738132 RepID=A0AAD7BI97_9AGAR|nr:kinase-like domain-containing protein [Roridomyces roridus]